MSSEAKPQTEQAAPANRAALLLFFLLAPVFLFVLNVSFGSVGIPFREIIMVVFGGESSNPAWARIIISFRLPRALTALAGGAALGVSGLLMQTLFRNPLADPSVLGINAGSTLGVAFVILSVSSGSTAAFMGGIGAIGKVTVVIAAILGAAVVLILVLAVSRKVGSVTVLLLFGIMFGYAANSMVTLLIHFSVAEKVQSYLYWTFGSFGTTTWSDLMIFLPVVAAALLFCQGIVKDLNALLLGESYAVSMGLSIKRVRTAIIAVTAVLAGAVSAFCGPVTFLGIAVPHLCRNILGTSDHRTLLPATILLGGAVALLADLISRLPASGSVLPLNAVTSLIGAPIVVMVLLKSWKESRFS